MALFTQQQMTFPIRLSNKEPEWATAYDDLFDQYIDVDPFEVNGPVLGGFSPDILSEGTSLSYEIPARTCKAGSSPSAKWESDEIEANYWAKAFHCLEDGAASFEQRGRQQSRSYNHCDTKVPIYPEFLQLGGHQGARIYSPPASPSESLRRRKTQSAESRSKSASRRSGISKPSRNGSKSPNMMTPSIYRAGFKDVWAEKIGNSPQSYALTLPIRSAPLSPPPSVKSKRVVDSTTFRSSNDSDAAPFQHVSFQEERLSLFSQQLSYHALVPEPYSSPLTTPGVEREKTYGGLPGDVFNDPFNRRSMFYAVPPAATRMSSPTAWNADAEGDQDDDYEVSPTFNPWGMAATKEQAQFTSEEDGRFGYPFVSASHRSRDNDDATLNELIVKCDPFMTTEHSNSPGDAELSALPTSLYIVPQEDKTQQVICRTPSPQPQRGRARSKHRNRRTPSTPRNSPRKVSASAFVNFTPSDSAKLLTGVAPSGSSKTKAKREKEAADKRRKLSQAAVKAVFEAGGDIDQLWNSGFLT
ncbi:hypothetical protein MBLNU459_g2181t1 [Dothideomycetes sp. NU459]